MFVSVLFGIALSRWHSVCSGVDERFLSSVMPGPQGTVWYSFVVDSSLCQSILVIFLWRILTKSLLGPAPHSSSSFPPSCILLRPATPTLPHPSTDYQHIPVESSLRPIPSVIDLPGVLEVCVRKNNGSELDNSNGLYQCKEVNHYDADVLTKVVVYAGMAILAAEGLPVTLPFWAGASSHVDSFTGVEFWAK
ncbi:hypothetical protein EV424DRAFT_1343059 [Suillus variegatus]|nr:hypothetical protein EV424DRAFT_1343059 [Suillus variegatus]